MNSTTIKTPGGVLVRVLAAIDGFHALFGTWPDAIEAPRETIADIENHCLTPLGLERLCSKLTLKPCEEITVVASGRDGADRFDYGASAQPHGTYPAVAGKWLRLDDSESGAPAPTATDKATKSTSATDYSSQIVYVLTNPAMPGLVKIGKTTQTEVEMRMKQLFGTGVPVPFDCAFACQVKDAHEVERALHFAFGNDRINPNREFFRIESERVVAVLKLLEVKDITGQVEQQIEADVTSADKQSAQQMKDRRPRMNFSDLGIPAGSILLSRDGQAEAKVVSETRVVYQGEEQSLTSATRKVLGLAPDTAIQPSPYWTFNGTSVKKLYEEFHDSASE